MPAQTLEQRTVPECFVSDPVPGCRRFVKTASNLHKLLLTLEKKDSENVSVSEDIFQKHSAYSMKTLNIFTHLTTTTSSTFQNLYSS